MWFWASWPFLLLGLATVSHSAHILGIFFASSPSHFILGDALMKALVSKGHQVTVISPFSWNKNVENYTEIILEVQKTKIDGIIKNSLTNEDQDALSFILQVIKLTKLGTEMPLLNVEVQRLLKSNVTFDLVIMQIAFNEAHMGFAEHFNCPLVILSTIGSSVITNDLFGNTAPYAYVPNPILPYTNHMTFLERVINTVSTAIYSLIIHWSNIPFQNSMLQKHFNTSKTVWDIINEKAPLILLNSHVSTSFPVPHVPSMVEIGGFHIKPKQLPQDIQEFLDSATDGAIYFSMGSNLKSSNFDHEKRDAILKVFSKLKQKVIWKWENETLSGQPSNVKLGKWMPQQDILAHPNVKLFITHGGLLSTTESVYNGVPAVIIPVFADQKMNALSAVNNGYAVQVSYQELNEENLYGAIKEILENPKYRQNVERRSALMKDRPINPMELAVFWVEHVIRHKGAHHLQVAALDLKWYQYLLLDVISFLLLIIFFSITAFCYVLKKLFQRKKGLKTGTEKKND